DVADRQQAAGLDGAQRADREKSRSLHLHGEHAALRPALVLTLVGVVEDVARDDRPDVHRLPDLLRGMDGAVDQLPARRRAGGLDADEMAGRAIVSDGRPGDDQVAELVVCLWASAGPDPQQL